MKIGHWNSVSDDTGAPKAATITVYLAGTAVLASIFADAGGTIVKDNPFQTDSLGRFEFFAAAGAYDIDVSGTGITTYKIPYIQLSDITKSTQLTDMPGSLTGQAGKTLVVNPGETAYQHVALGGGTHNLLSATHPDVTAGTPVLGDIIVADSTPKWKRKAGQTTATRKFLRQKGSGEVSAEPDWDTLQAGDVPAHGSSHQSGGEDAIKLDDLAAPDNNTDLNVGITKHGLCPKAPNDTTKFFRGDATYAIPAPISAFNDITADMIWNDAEQTLDLTAKTAASASWVILSCYINRAGDYVGSLIWRRYSDGVELARVTMVHTGGTDAGGVCVLPLDSDQRLKYVAPSGTTTKYVKILGYW